MLFRSDKFSQQEYEFKVIGMAPEADLRRFGTYFPGEMNGSMAFRMLLHDAHGLYGVMETLRHHGVTILAVNKKEANLEDVFVQITEGTLQDTADAKGVQASA